ncbi:MAG: anti-sigma factor [Chloroflexi bacterium]|nr:anti-sigma factor [Chloroflexota bacterium]
MPPTPVDDHTEEFEQLAGLAALEVLEGDELAAFQQHAAHCERCQVMVRLDREALALAAPEMDPSPDFKARLLQRAAEELAEAPAPLTVDHFAPEDSGNVIQFPWWRRTPRWASAVAAVFVLGVVVLGGYSYENQVVASYPLAGTLSGSAVVNVRRSGAAELQLRGVATPPPGFLYEAWIIPPGGAPIPAGTTPNGDGTLPLNDVGSGVTVAITQERQRVDAPTSPPVLAVQL